MFAELSIAAMQPCINPCTSCTVEDVTGGTMHANTQPLGGVGLPPAGRHHAPTKSALQWPLSRTPGSGTKALQLQQQRPWSRTPGAVPGGACSLIAKTRRAPSPDGRPESAPLTFGGTTKRVSAPSGGAPLGSGDKFEHAFEPRGIRTRMRMGADDAKHGSVDRSNGGSDEEGDAIQVRWLSCGQCIVSTCVSV